MKQKQEILISIEDVIENLTTITEWLEENNAPIGIVKRNIIVLDDEDFPYKDITWISEENIYDIYPYIKENYEILLEYLKEINNDPKIDWSDKEIVCGLKSILTVSAEAAHKLDNFIGKLKNVKIEKLTKSQLYNRILSFYANEIQKKFLKDEWEEKWEENEQGLNLDLERIGLNNFDVIRKDERYELFYLVDEEERPLFTQALLSNVKFSCDYSEALKTEDPLLPIKVFKDNELSGIASYVLKEIKPLLHQYCKAESFKRKDKLIVCLNKAIFALMLAANSNNRIVATTKKCSSKYFQDFISFIKDIFLTDEYRHCLENSDNTECKNMLNIIHTLCHILFLRPHTIKEEMSGYIHKLIREGKDKEKSVKSSNLFEKILHDDENIRHFFSQFPNGPLFKVLDVIHERENGEVLWFDPMLQQNMPAFLYHCDMLKKQASMLRIPCPTKQHYVFKAQILGEFLGFLRSLQQDNFFAINLQERSSFLEYTRCHVLEELQNDVEFSSKITLVTLDCHSEFYHQAISYVDMNDAKMFLKEFKQQILNKEGNFYFPKKIPIATFVDELLAFVHADFFSAKSTLSVEERLDFIEIFYFFLTVKLLELSNANLFSFICKDGVDISACKNGLFYAANKLLKKHKLENEDIENFLLFVYSPAILIRERTVDGQRLIRTVSALAHLTRIIEA